MPIAPDSWLPALQLCRRRPGVLHAWRSDQPLCFDPQGEFHQIPSLWLCLAGAARLMRRGGQTDLAAGDAVAMEPGVWHRHEPLTGDAAAMHLGFTASWCDVSVKTRAWWRIWRLPFQPARDAIEDLLAAEAAGERLRHASRLLTTVANGQLVELDAAARPLWAMLGGMWRLAYDGAVSADEILRKSGLSRGHAYRLFTAFYGTGPARAVEIMRLDLARWLLFRGHRIGEVARISGFRDRHGFTRRWTRQFGASPRAFRGRLAPLPAGGYASNHRSGESRARPGPATAPRQRFHT